MADDLFFGLVDGVDDAGAATDDTVVALLSGHPLGDLVPEGRVLPLADVRLVAPILPSKVIGVSANYRGAEPESMPAFQAEPTFFLKPSTSVIGPGESIMLPWQSERVEPAGTLAVVIKRLCRDVPAERADEVIWGYACANDVTARDIEQADGQSVRAKSFDTFCPLGPWVTTDLRIGDASIQCIINGAVRQQADLADLVIGVPQLVESISSVMTLVPGDVILTGTPAGIGTLTDGDTVTVAIDQIGSLTNGVVDRG